MRCGAWRSLQRAGCNRRRVSFLLLLGTLAGAAIGFAQSPQGARLFDTAQWSASVEDLPANRLANFAAVYSVDSVQVRVYVAADRGTYDRWTDNACERLPAFVLQDNRQATVLAVQRNAFWLFTATADPRLDLCAFTAAFATQFEALLSGSGRRVAFDRAAAVPEFPAFVGF